MCDTAGGDHHCCGCNAEAKPAEAKPAEVPPRRLWLTGSVQSSPGLSGFYRTARTEPMGERLRMLLNGALVLAPALGKPPDQKGGRTLSFHSEPQKASGCNASSYHA